MHTQNQWNDGFHVVPMKEHYKLCWTSQLLQKDMSNHIEQQSFNPGSQLATVPGKMWSKTSVWRLDFSCFDSVHRGVDSLTFLAGCGQVVFPCFFPNIHFVNFAQKSGAPARGFPGQWWPRCSCRICWSSSWWSSSCQCCVMAWWNWKKVYELNTWILIIKQNPSF